MPSGRDDTAQRLERFADTELLYLLRSGELTKLAQEVAVAELTRRGVDVPAAEPQTLPAVTCNPLSAGTRST